MVTVAKKEGIRKGAGRGAGRVVGEYTEWVYYTLRFLGETHGDASLRTLSLGECGEMTEYSITVILFDFFIFIFSYPNVF